MGYTFTRRRYQREGITETDCSRTNHRIQKSRAILRDWEIDPAEASTFFLDTAYSLADRIIRRRAAQIFARKG